MITLIEKDSSRDSLVLATQEGGFFELSLSDTSLKNEAYSEDFTSKLISEFVSNAMLLLEAEALIDFVNLGEIFTEAKKRLELKLNSLERIPT